MILSAPALALAAAITAQELSAPGPSGDLRGTWTKASDPDAPVVLIIPGSGPTDRDGNSPLGIAANAYRLLAEGLAEVGVSTIRIDKRGMFASAGDPNAVVIEDYVDDTRSWVGTIRERTGRPCVWLLGHSEGGLVALAAAGRDPNVCGLILVAAPGRPMGEVLREQLHANPANAPFLDEADAAIDALTNGERIDGDRLSEPLMPLFAPTLQGFLISAFALDPAALAKSVDKPMLILQGESDLQVGLMDSRALRATTPTAEFVLLADTNHVLKVAPPNDPAANLRTYSDPDLPLAPGVVDAIRRFVATQERGD